MGRYVGKFGERCGKVCWSVGGDVEKRGKVCWGVGEVWELLGEEWNVEKVRGRRVGRDEGKCMGMIVKSVATCVEKFDGCGGRCEKVYWGVG